MTVSAIIAVGVAILGFGLTAGVLVGRAIGRTQRITPAADEHAEWLGADAGGSFTHIGDV